MPHKARPRARPARRRSSVNPLMETKKPSFPRDMRTLLENAAVSLRGRELFQFLHSTNMSPPHSVQNGSVPVFARIMSISPFSVFTLRSTILKDCRNRRTANCSNSFPFSCAGRLDSRTSASPRASAAGAVLCPLRPARARLARRRERRSVPQTDSCAAAKSKVRGAN